MEDTPEPTTLEDLVANAREYLSELSPDMPEYAPALEAVIKLERLSNDLANDEIERWTKTSDQEIKVADHDVDRQVKAKPPLAPTVVTAGAQLGSVGLIVFAERIAVIASKALPMAFRIIP